MHQHLCFPYSFSCWSLFKLCIFNFEFSRYKETSTVYEIALRNVSYVIKIYVTWEPATENKDSKDGKDPGDQQRQQEQDLRKARGPGHDEGDPLVPPRPPAA